jgi:putative ABC transport system permease protein
MPPKGADEGGWPGSGIRHEPCAPKDIRHGLFRFVLTCFGLGLLMTVVLAMIGIYNGLVADALAVVKAPAADVWVVEAGTKGPFAEASSIPPTRATPWPACPAWPRPGAINYQTIEAPMRAAPCGFTSSAMNPAVPVGRSASPKGAASAPAISNWWPTARPGW